jgi:transcriptional regulator with XRE-family HTH domain
MDWNASTNEAQGQEPKHLMDMGEVCDEFRRLRIGLKRSQESVAKELGITQASLSAWETGKNAALRAHTMNKVIRLIETWRTASNILPIPSDRIKPPSRRAKAPRTTKSAAALDEEARRRKLVETLREMLGPDPMCSEVLSQLPFKKLMDYYIYLTGG